MEFNIECKEVHPAGIAPGTQPDEICFFKIQKSGVHVEMLYFVKEELETSSIMAKSTTAYLSLTCCVVFSEQRNSVIYHHNISSINPNAYSKDIPEDKIRVYQNKVKSNIKAMNRRTHPAEYAYHMTRSRSIVSQFPAPSRFR